MKRKLSSLAVLAVAVGLVCSYFGGASAQTTSAAPRAVQTPPVDPTLWGLMAHDGIVTNTASSITPPLIPITQGRVVAHCFRSASAPYTWDASTGTLKWLSPLTANLMVYKTDGSLLVNQPFSIGWDGAARIYGVSGTSWTATQLFGNGVWNGKSVYVVCFGTKGEKPTMTCYISERSTNRPVLILSGSTTREQYVDF